MARRVANITQKTLAFATGARQPLDDNSIRPDLPIDASDRGGTDGAHPTRDLP